MPIRLAALILLFISSSCYANSADKTILVIGDSISSAYGMVHSEGWVSLLSSKLLDEQPDYQVVNASITGDLSASGKQRIGRLLTTHSPEVVIIELGGNDSLRGQPIRMMKANLQNMIEQVTKSGSSVLLAGMRIPPNYGPRYTNAFAQAYVDLAENNNISLIPFILDGIGDVPEMMQSDGIHPNIQAQAKILENVWPHLQPLLK